MGTWRIEKGPERTRRGRHGHAATSVDAETLVAESWGGLLDFIASPRPSGSDTSPCQSSQSNESFRESWSGTKTFDDAAKLARDGWREGTDKVRALSRRLEARLIHKIVREDWNYNVEGMAFDVSRYLTGEPEHWIHPEETDLAENAHRHVRVIANVCASAGISAATIMARGAAVAALIELLEYAGHRVELWTVCPVSVDYGSDAYVANARVKVKAYDQPIDPSRIAFALVHPSMLRRIMFSVYEHLSTKVQRTIGGSYGMPADDRMDDENAIYLGKALWDGSTWNTPESAEAWILAQLASQGVVLRDDAE